MKENTKYYTISIRIKEDFKERLEAFAKEHDLSMSQVVCRAIEKYLSENN